MSGRDMLSSTYTLQAQTMNWVGAALILVAVVFFAVDLVVTAHGLPTFAGIVALILGVLTLFDAASPYSQAALIILVTAGVLVMVLFVTGSREALAARGRPAETGAEAMIGEIGVVREPVGVETPGWVFVHGEWWRAIPAIAPEDAYAQDREQTIGVGHKVQVVGLRDGTVTVLPFEPAESEHPLGR
jgi:membrane-bound serine protease (ClpP class)